MSDTKNTESSAQSEIRARIDARREADAVRKERKVTLRKDLNEHLERLSAAGEAVSAVYQEEKGRINKERNEFQSAHDEAVAEVDKEWREATGQPEKYAGPWYNSYGERDKYSNYDADGNYHERD